MAQEGEQHNEKQPQCYSLYLKISLRKLMVQKIIIHLFLPRLFHFHHGAVYHYEELPAELMSVKQVKDKV